MNLKISVFLYFYLIFTFLFISSKIIAQHQIYPEHAYVPEDSLPEYNFTLLRNNPDSVSRFTISLYPMYPTRSNLLLTWYNALAEIKLTYDISKKFTLDGHFAMAYINEWDEPNFSPKNFKPDHDYNLNFIWNFILKNKESQIHTGLIRIKNKPPGTVINLGFEGHIINKIGLRLGISDINKAVSSSTFGDGQVDLIGYDINDPLKTQIDLRKESKYTVYKWHTPEMVSYCSYMEATCLNLGFQLERIVDFRADMDVLGKREVSKKTRLYADLIYAPYIYYDDIFVTSTTADPPVTLNVNDYTQKEHFGFRVGYSFFNLKKFGGSRTIELGYFPNTGIYAMLKIGMAFNPKISAKKR